MPFKFERLEVWKASLDYVDLAYKLAEGLPAGEEYNLTSQLRRAATSVALNIAEGSTGQTDKEHARFIGMAIRSLVETVACLRLIERRKYPGHNVLGHELDLKAQELARRLHTLRKVLDPAHGWLRERAEEYDAAEAPDENA